MSMSGTPTEYLELGILEPTDTLNTLVDLNGQWRKVDTGVKDVNTKADTNASNITSLNTQVHDNTENITNILDTNVNQQDDIDLLKTKVQTLETHDGDYETRITNNTNGVQENSELINDLEEDVSGIHLSIGTVPEGETVEGQISDIDTRVTALENDGSVDALETRVGRVEDSLGTVPSGSTVQGQIDGIDTRVDTVEDSLGSVPSGSTVQGQIDSIDSQLTGTLSGNDVPFRFSINGEGKYGYLKADDSFVPFSSGASLTPYPNGLTRYSSGGATAITTKPYVALYGNNQRYLYDIVNDNLITTQYIPETAGCRYVVVDGGIKDIISDTTYSYASNTMYVISGENVNKFTFNGTTITRTYNGQTYTLTTSNNVSLSNLNYIRSNLQGTEIWLKLAETSSTTLQFCISGINTTSASILSEQLLQWAYIEPANYTNGYYGLINTLSGACMGGSNTPRDFTSFSYSNGRFYGQPNFFVMDITPSNNSYLLKENGYIIL